MSLTSRKSCILGLFSSGSFIETIAAGTMNPESGGSLFIRIYINFNSRARATAFVRLVTFNLR